MLEYNILYVDDEEANLNSLKSLFRRKFNIITAISGQEGLNILATQPIHLIIADQRMPNMTGVEFLKKVKEKWPEIKYILLTGFYDNEVIKEAVNDVGIFWYINKPFNNDQLEHIINQALESFNSAKLLKESEEKFRGVFNSIPDGYVRRNLQGNIVMASPSVLDIAGYTPDELINDKIEKFFVDPQVPEKIVQKLSKNGGTLSIETEVFKKDGSIITISSSAKLFYDDAGNPLGVESVFRDITDKKRAEKALKESEEKFKGVFNSLIDVFIRRDFEHKGVMTSPSIFEVTGYEIEDIVGQDISKYFADPQKPEWIKQYLLENRGVQTIEFELYKKDGTIITVSSNAKVYYDSDDNPIGIESVFRDVTRQKIAEEALKESKERYQSLSDASFEAIFISEKGVCVEQNALAEKMFGYTLLEAVGRKGTDWIIPEDREMVMNKMLAGDDSEAYETTALRKDGSTFPAEIQARMMPIKGRGVRVTALNDITERKKAEHKLKESEEKFKTLVTNTEEIIYMIAKDGTFLLSEGKGLEKLGLKGGEVEGQSVYDLYKDLPELLDKMNLAFSGETIIMEHEVGDIWFKSWYTPHFDQAGEIIGLLGLAINITEQKQAESKNLEYQKRLKALTAELTLTEEKQRKQIASDLHDHVGQFMASSRLQLLAINEGMESKDILLTLQDISGDLSQGIKAIRTAIFDLSTPQLNEIGLFAAISDWTEEKIELKHGIKIHLSGDDQIYPLEENTRILLFRSIRELLINVVKHAKATEVNVEIREKSGNLEITIEDNGVGFASNHETRSKKNYGLGIFSIEERLSDLGGSINIDSSKKGTKVKLKLSLADLDPMLNL